MPSLSDTAPGFESNSSRGFFDALSNRTGLLAGIAGALLVIGAGVAYWTSRDQGQSIEGRNALYSAREAHDKELAAISAERTPAPAKPVAGQPAAPAVAADAAAFAKIDVDAKFPAALKAYREVAEKFRGSRSAYEANLALGDLYFNHGQADKALPYFQAAIKDAKGMEKALVEYALGYTYAATGNHGEAIGSFERALKSGDLGLKGDILLALARNHEAKQEAAPARAAYDRIIAEMPGTEAAKSAEIFKAKLQ